jgi:Ca2+-binding EF-hand superfamily protein
MFAAFDKNGDGMIDFSEFVLGIGVAQSKDLNTTLDFSFEM